MRKVIEAGNPVLGICLGAQLIATAMGGQVFPNSMKEIGWFPIRSVATETNSAFVFPESTEVFHWHGETFSLPPGAIRIAESDGCENQAFQIGRSVIGLQFHLETTPNRHKNWLPISGTSSSQHGMCSAERIFYQKARNYTAINRLMSDVLSYLAQGNGR